MEFPQILKDYLQEQGLSQVAFAERVGVKQSQISEWLHGKAKPGYDLLKQIVRRTGVTADFWLGLSDKY